MIKSYVVGILTYNLEACKPIIAEIRTMNRIMSILTRMIMTPMELLYRQIGKLDVWPTI